MKILYDNSHVEKTCTNLNFTRSFFGGNEDLVISLSNKLFLLNQAICLKDIANLPSLHFHKLKNAKGHNLLGYYAIDIKGRKGQYRLLFQLANTKDINTEDTVKIMEVSKHYE